MRQDGLPFFSIEGKFFIKQYEFDRGFSISGKIDFPG